MKSRLIVNPVSGSDSGPDYLRTINERLREWVGDMDIVMSVAPDDPLQAGERAARDGYDHLFIAGGDGTLNQVLNGVARVEGALSNLTFGLIPLGTGNDFANALGLPEKVDEAIKILQEGHTVAVDVGVLNDRYFINVSAGGFIAEVSDAINPQLKTVAGKLAYLIGGAKVLLDYEPVNLWLQAVEKGGTTRRDLSLQMYAVCNSRLVGGGRLIAPDAVINDGWLDVCVVEPMPMLEFIGLLTRVSSGDHVDDKRVAYFRACELELRFGRTIKVNTDGEVLQADRCHYRIRPGAARFLAGAAPYALR
jgi:diacylglycerol kinase (ATP)